jgi:VIT1/CCC1 family predicted Fe2+/Mn2+ transporter
LVQMQDLGMRILLIVVGLLLFASGIYVGYTSGFAFWTVWDIIGGIVLILIGIFAKGIMRK